VIGCGYSMGPVETGWLSGHDTPTFRGMEWLPASRRGSKTCDEMTCVDMAPRNQSERQQLPCFRIGKAHAEYNSILNRILPQDLATGQQMPTRAGGLPENPYENLEK